MRSRAERIDSNRHAGLDDRSLAGVERRLAEVRDALRAFTPVESLVGLDETILGPAERIDHIATSTQDPAALEQLEGAIVGLRGILAHVAFNDALATLFEAVRSLGAKVDILERNDQRTQDSIESVHGTLRLVVERLAAIESCLRSQPQPKSQVTPALLLAPAAPIDLSLSPDHPPGAEDRGP